MANVVTILFHLSIHFFLHSYSSNIFKVYLILLWVQVMSEGSTEGIEVSDGMSLNILRPMKFHFFLPPTAKPVSKVSLQGHSLLRTGMLLPLTLLSQLTLPVPEDLTLRLITFLSRIITLFPSLAFPSLSRHKQTNCLIRLGLG